MAKNVQESWQKIKYVVSESNCERLGIAVYESTSGGKSKDSFHDSTTLHLPHPIEEPFIFLLC